MFWCKIRSFLCGWWGVKWCDHFREWFERPGPQHWVTDDPTIQLLATHLRPESLFNPRGSYRMLASTLVTIGREANPDVCPPSSRQTNTGHGDGLHSATAWGKPVFDAPVWINFANIFAKCKKASHERSLKTFHRCRDHTRRLHQLSTPKRWSQCRESFQNKSIE